jgi:hypothetical protein
LLIRTYGCKFYLIYILRDQKLSLTCWRKMNPDMTMIENSYTMPLLFGVCRKQGHCCISAIGVVTVPAATVMRSSD